jgi:hypothetical protein
MAGGLSRIALQQTIADFALQCFAGGRTDGRDLLKAAYAMDQVVDLLGE